MKRRILRGDSIEDMTVSIWETETGKEVKVIQGYPASVFAVAFSPDGKRIASVCDGGMARIEKSPVPSAAQDKR